MGGRSEMGIRFPSSPPVEIYFKEAKILSYVSLIGSGLGLLLKDKTSGKLLALDDNDFGMRYLIFDAAAEGIKRIRWVRDKEVKDIRGA